jgi:hypothetical protein
LYAPLAQSNGKRNLTQLTLTGESQKEGNAMNKDYKKQADDFLKATNTTFKAKLYKHNKYFSDDKEIRDIYKITLRRKNVGSYTFTFGTSINDTKKNITPNAYDVLACLQKYEVSSFEDFCYDFGYNTDSRKAEKTYKAVLKEYKNVYRLFSDVMEQLDEIQ